MLRHEVQPTAASQLTIASARYHSARILAGQDDRILVIVGPCSIHSAEQAIEYAHLLKSKMSSWDNLHIVMRAYLLVFLSLLNPSYTNVIRRIALVRFENQAFTYLMVADILL